MEPVVDLVIIGALASRTLVNPKTIDDGGAIATCDCYLRLLPIDRHVLCGETWICC